MAGHLSIAYFRLVVLIVDFLQKREEDESIQANMKQYNLEHRYLDVLVNDFAASFWKDSIQFDSIITDREWKIWFCIFFLLKQFLAPYGIREATEKIGTSKENYTVKEEHLSTHIPAKIEYGISNIYQDLLIFSAKHLTVGGRLVCWFPVFRLVKIMRLDIYRNLISNIYRLYPSDNIV